MDKPKKTETWAQIAERTTKKKLPRVTIDNITYNCKLIISNSRN